MEEPESELAPQNGALECWRWAQEQMAGVDCGDARRERRLAELLCFVARQPGCSLPQQCVEAAPLKAAYRLLQSDAVQPGALIGSAARATVEHLERDGSKGVLLAVQDTTSLDFTTHEALSGRGPITGKEHFQGFHAHTTMLLGEEALVHGLLDCEIYARDAAAQRARKPGERNRQSSEQKESHRWVRSVQTSAALCGWLPQVEAVVNIADREADMYELLWEAQRLHQQHAGRFHLLVRAQHNRQLEGLDQRLWEHLAQRPAQACWELSLPAPKGLHGVQQRRVEALWDTVRLAVPAHQRKHHGHEQPVEAVIIVVREPVPPAGQHALEWVLITTWPVDSVEELQRVTRWYARRWQIEVLHRVWKTGCNTEHRRLQEARAAQVMLVLDLLTALRIMSLASAARHEPEAPAERWLTTVEEQVLRARFESPKTGTAGKPLSLGQAARWISQLGGHRGAPSSPPPGAEALWRGLTRLNLMTDGWHLAQASQKCG